jgi:dTDP-4-amino-4,6-dideoxygalactose transaminase
VKNKIPIIRPDVAMEDIKADIADILASGILTGGKYVEEFETTVADWVGVRHGIATTSATTAIHLALNDSYPSSAYCGWNWARR